jgi:hypothetical protein
MSAHRSNPVTPIILAAFTLDSARAAFNANQTRETRDAMFKAARELRELAPDHGALRRDSTG